MNRGFAPVPRTHASSGVQRLLADTLLPSALQKLLAWSTRADSQIIQAALQRCCALGSIRGKRGHRRTSGGRCSGNRVNSAIDADCRNQRVIRSRERSCGRDKSRRNGSGAGRTPNLYRDRRGRTNRRAHHLSAQQVSRALCHSQGSEHVNRLHSIGIARAAWRKLFGFAIPANARVQCCGIALLIDIVRRRDPVRLHVDAHPFVAQRKGSWRGDWRGILQSHPLVRIWNCCAPGVANGYAGVVIMTELDVKVRARRISGVNRLSSVRIEHIQHAIGIAGDIRGEKVSESGR